MSLCRTKLPSGWPLGGATRLTNRNFQTPDIRQSSENRGLAVQAASLSKPFPGISKSSLCLGDRNTPHSLRLKRAPSKGREPQGHRAREADTVLKPSPGVATSRLPALISKERNRDADVSHFDPALRTPDLKTRFQVVLPPPGFSGSGPGHPSVPALVSLQVTHGAGPSLGGWGSCQSA